MPSGLEARGEGAVSRLFDAEKVRRVAENMLCCVLLICDICTGQETDKEDTIAFGGVFTPKIGRPYRNIELILSVTHPPSGSYCVNRQCRGN